jgi:hypothetical protein
LRNPAFPNPDGALLAPFLALSTSTFCSITTKANGRWNGLTTFNKHVKSLKMAYVFLMDNPATHLGESN